LDNGLSLVIRVLGRYVVIGNGHAGSDSMVGARHVGEAVPIESRITARLSVEPSPGVFLGTKEEPEGMVLLLQDPVPRPTEKARLWSGGWRGCQHRRLLWAHRLGPRLIGFSWRPWPACASFVLRAVESPRRLPIKVGWALSVSALRSCKSIPIVISYARGSCERKANANDVPCPVRRGC
jgi:hypothetical protein